MAVEETRDKKEVDVCCASTSTSRERVRARRRMTRRAGRNQKDGALRDGGRRAGAGESSNEVESSLTGATSLHVAVEAGDCPRVRAIMTALIKTCKEAPELLNEEGQAQSATEEVAVGDDVKQTLGGLVNGIEMICDNDGATPLHYGATRGQWQAMKEMLDAINCSDVGDINSKGYAEEQIIKAKDSEGRTALHWAAANAKGETVQFLIGRGANVHSADRQGRTALHGASLAGNANVIRLLLKNGASVNAKTADGQTPIMMALKTRRQGCVKVLKDNVRVIYVRKRYFLILTLLAVSFVLTERASIEHYTNI